MTLVGRVKTELLAEIAAGKKIKCNKQEVAKRLRMKNDSLTIGETICSEFLLILNQFDITAKELAIISGKNPLTSCARQQVPGVLRFTEALRMINTISVPTQVAV